MKYWVYMNGEVPGSYTPAELSTLSGFTMTTLVCPSEGESLEKAWRRAGEFADLIAVLHEREARTPPPAPAPEPPLGGDVNALIDATSARLFSQVAELVSELGNRREERSLTVSLQRQLLDLKEQLKQAREKAAFFESRIPRIAELEASLTKDESHIQKLEAALKDREDGLSELRMQLEKAKTDLESARRRLGEATNDLGIRNRLVDRLSRDLAEKEVSLSKAMGVIRRLEEDLNRISPVAVPASAPEIPVLKRPQPLPEPSPVQEFPPAPEEPLAAVAAAPERAYTTDEPPPAPPPQSPPEPPPREGVLAGLFKKLLSRRDL